jgi:23S rRNA pseudouridine1911/1915/1917 synthase
MEHLEFTKISGRTVGEFLKSFHAAPKIINGLIQDQSITVGGKPVSLDHVLVPGEILCVPISDSRFPIPWVQPLQVVYEDEDILIVNKPVGIIIHPDGNDQKTLDNIVFAHFLSEGLRREPRHVHRLDADTSGLVVYAKHFLAHAFLSWQIEQKLFRKKYYAIAMGKMENQQGTISLNIGRNRHCANKYLVFEGGKAAVTDYKVLRQLPNMALLEVEPQTGRTHQIRVHLAALGHPLFGDKLYGKPDRRMMLHSCFVSFVHPRTRKTVVFETPVPEDFALRGIKQ